MTPAGSEEGRQKQDELFESQKPQLHDYLCIRWRLRQNIFHVAGVCTSPVRRPSRLFPKMAQMGGTDHIHHHIRTNPKALLFT